LNCQYQPDGILCIYIYIYMYLSKYVGCLSNDIKTGTVTFLKQKMQRIIFQNSRSKYTVWVIRRNMLMLCGEIIAVCSENRTEHAYTLCGRNVTILDVKVGGISSIRGAL